MSDMGIDNEERVTDEVAFADMAAAELANLDMEAREAISRILGSVYLVADQFDDAGSAAVRDWVDLVSLQGGFTSPSGPGGGTPEGDPHG